MNIGIKIVDKSISENKKRLNKYEKFYRSLNGNELAIYNTSEDYLHNVNYFMLHSNTDKIGINVDKKDIELYLENKVIPIMKKNNINRVVVHMIAASGLEKYTKEELREYVLYLVSISKKYNIKIYLENCYNDIDSMKELFDYDKEKILNFCFDIGHAKALNLKRNNNIDDWLDFIKNLNRAVHVHYHTNDGEGDQHLPVTIKTNKQINIFHNGKDYFEILKELKEILKDNKDSNIILETHPKYTKQNKKIIEKLLT